MILKELKLSHFGKFEDKKVSLKPGINIIYGKNEAGKSTVHSFIRGMLFGIERQRGRASKDDFYTRYIPWNSNGKYDGVMDLVAGSKEYRLIRNFEKNHKEFRILDLQTGREIVQKNGDISDVIPGITESIYRNTVSIEQLHTSTDVELAREVQNYIANLSISKTNEVDVHNALNFLNAKKKEIQGKLEILDTNHLSKELEQKLDEMNQVDQLNEDLLSLEQQERLLREKKEAFLNDEMKIQDLNGDKRFAEMRQKFLEYQELSNKCEESTIEYKQLTKTINDLLRVENSHKTIYRDVEEVNQLHEKTHNLQVKLGEIRRQEEQMIHDSKLGKRLYYIVPILVAELLVCIFLNPTIGISLCVGTITTMIVMYLIKQARLQGRLHHLEGEEIKIDRECIEAEAKKREIFLRNHVTDDSELRYKMQMLRENQEEFDDYKRRRSEVEKQQIHIYGQIESLQKDLYRYARLFYPDVELNEELICDIEYEVNRRKENAEREFAEICEQYESVVKRLERVKWELSNYEQFEEELQRKQKLYEEAFENKCRLEKDLQAVLLAMESINTLSIDIHDSFGEQINHRISYIVEKVTNGRYTDVKMDENLDIKVLREDDYVPFHRLSAGAIAEIYLALRITIADILNGTKTLPLILDDMMMSD